MQKHPTDYSTLFVALDELVAADLLHLDKNWMFGQWQIRKGRSCSRCGVSTWCAPPDVAWFSPQNLQRVRDFYRAFGSAPEVMAEATSVGWAQNIVILEAKLTLQEQAWYIRIAQQFGGPRLELTIRIASKAHLEIVLDFGVEVCYTEENAVAEKVSGYAAD